MYKNIKISKFRLIIIKKKMYDRYKYISMKHLNKCNIITSVVGMSVVFDRLVPKTKVRKKYS